VIGIGGSSLGVKAIYEFLLPSNKYQKDLVFLPFNKLSTSTPTIASGTKPTTLNTEKRPPTFSANSKT
jgi:glucose-6-phosphate isomerase